MKPDEESFLRGLISTDSEYDQDIDAALGVRRLTDDERRHLQGLLASRLTIRPDGEPDEMGRFVDEIIGLLRYY